MVFLVWSIAPNRPEALILELPAPIGDNEDNERSKPAGNKTHQVLIPHVHVPDVLFTIHLLAHFDEYCIFAVGDIVFPPFS